MTKKEPVNAKDPILEALSNTNEEVELLAWESDERIYKEKSRDFWVTVIAALVLFSIILVMFKEFGLVFALAAFFFFYYATSTVKPGRMKYRLTNRGVYIADSFYPFFDLANFWFSQKDGYKIFNVGTQLRIPRVLTILIPADCEEKVKNIFIKILPLIKPQEQFVEKLGKWFSSKIFIEKEEKTKGEKKEG